MNLTLRQLTAFVHGAESGSFSTAAGRMGLSQPGYSLLIRQLEQVTGLRLFDRTTRRVELTDAGRDLLDGARRALRASDEVLRRADELREMRQGRLRLAVVPSVACSVLPAVLARYCTVYPDIRLEFFEDQAAGFAGRVRHGEAEIGMGVLLHPDPELTFTVLLKDYLVVILPADHPLAARKTITWRSLARYPYISVTTQSSVRVYADQATASAGVELHPGYEVGSLTAAVGLVRSGLGYAVLPSLGARAIDLAGVLARPIDEPRAWREVGLLRRAQHTLSPSAAAFMATARAMGPRLAKEAAALL